MRSLLVFLFIASLWLRPSHSKAQSFEAQQLLLNYAKLVQLEEILDQMYKGYKILSDGYNVIKNISEGNFNLHKVFLDGLLAVNPSIAKYKRIPDIIRYQQAIMDEYRRGMTRIRQDDELSADEVRYIERLYSNLIKRTLRGLDELVNIVTATKLRMSDDERLKGIDRLHHEMVRELRFVRSLNSYTHELARQRAKTKNELETMQALEGLN
jgi:hypothetical protein